MKARTAATLATLAMLALAGCSGDPAPTHDPSRDEEAFDLAMEQVYEDAGLLPTSDLLASARDVGDAACLRIEEVGVDTAVAEYRDLTADMDQDIAGMTLTSAVVYLCYETYVANGGE